MNATRQLSLVALLAGTCVASQAAGVYSAVSTARIALDNGAFVPTTIVQVKVPAGTWVVQSKVNVINWLNQDYDRCQLVAGIAVINGASTMTGQLDGMPAAATVVNMGVVTTTAPQVFQLKCSHDFAVPNQAIDPDAVLVVTRAPAK